MIIHIHGGRWLPIVCLPYGYLRDFHKGCIHGLVHVLLPTLTYPQWYTRLPMVHLMQVPKGLPDTGHQSQGIKLGALCY